MNLGYVVSSFVRGGAETMLLRHVRYAGRRPIVFRLGGSPDLEAEFRAAGATTVNLGLDSVVSPAGLNRARAQFGEYDLDVLHAHMPSPMIVARLAGRAAGVRTLVSTHHTVAQNYPPALRMLERTTRPLDDSLVAVSDAVRRTQSSVLDTPGWTTIYNGIDVDEFNRDVATANPPDGIDADGPVILNVGRYIPEKGQRYLVEAMPGVLQRYPEARAVLVGYGELRDDIEAQVAKLGLNDHVQLTGKVSDVHRYYAGADVFVIPSLFEGLPITALEAMAAGLPVVGTRVPGVSEAVSAEIGSLVPPASPERLSRAIIDVLADGPVERGERSVDRARRTFDIEHTVDAHERLYATLAT